MDESMNLEAGERERERERAAVVVGKTPAEPVDDVHFPTDPADQISVKSSQFGSSIRVMDGDDGGQKKKKNQSPSIRRIHSGYPVLILSHPNLSSLPHPFACVM